MAVRTILLYLGRPADKRERLVETLKTQAMDLDASFSLDSKAVIDAVFEWLVASGLPNIVWIVVVGRCCSAICPPFQCTRASHCLVHSPRTNDLQCCHCTVCSLTCSALNLPTHAPLIAAVLAVILYSGGDTTDAVVAAIPVRLRSAMVHGDSIRVRLLLRFIASLAAVNVIAPADALSQFTQLLTGAHQRDAAEMRCLMYGVLAALPWMSNSSDGPCSRLGLASADAADAAQELMQRLETLVETDGIVPSLEAAAASGSALTAARQSSAASCSWIDALPEPAARLGVDVAALCAHPVRRLYGMVAAAIAPAKPTAGADKDDDNDAMMAETQPVDGGAGTATSSSSSSSPAPAYHNLAVPSIARPQDDDAVVIAMGLFRRNVAKKTESNSSSNGDGGAAAADTGMVDDADAGGAGAAAEGTAAAVDADAGCSGGFHIPKRKRVSESGASAPGKKGRTGPLSYRPVYINASLQYAIEDEEKEDAAPLPAPPTDVQLLRAQSQWYVRPSVQLFGPGGGLSGTAAAMRVLKLDGEQATPLALWAVREVAHDSIALFHPFHAEAAKRLFFVPMGKGRGAPIPFNPLPLAIEAVLTQALWLPSPPTPTQANYYSVLLLDLFREDTEEGGGDPKRRLAPAILGLACRVLFKYLPLLDPFVVDTRLSTWMAHHVSNTEYSWLWAEWTSCLGDATQYHDPQRRFVTTLLQRVFSLVGSYQPHYQNVLLSLPAEYLAAGLVPARVTSKEAASSMYLPAADVPQQQAEPAPSPQAAAAAAASSDDFIALEGGADGSASAAAPADPESDIAVTTGHDADVTPDEADVLRRTAPGAHVTAHSTGAGTPDASMAAAAVETAGFASASALQLALSSSTLGADPALLASLRPFAKAAQAKLREKVDDGAMTVWFNEEAGAEGAPARDHLLKAFSHALVLHGKANIKNASTLFQRYHGLLTGGCGIGDATSRAHAILAAVTEVWSSAAHVVVSVIQAALDTGVVTPSHVVSFAIEPCTENYSDASILKATSLPRLASTTACWDVVHSTLQRASAAYEAAGVEVALFLGGDVYDEGTPDQPKPQLYEDEAIEKEMILREKQRATGAAFRQALFTAVETGARIIRAVQSYQAGTAAGGNDDPRADGGADATEVLRIVLSHMREVGRCYAKELATPAGDDAITHALEASSHLLVHPSHHTSAAAAALSSSAAGHLHQHDANHDLAGALLHAFRHYAKEAGALHVPPPLLRDRELPQPAAESS